MKAAYTKIKDVAFKLYQNDFFYMFFEIAKTMMDGKNKYPKNNWLERDPKEHMSHIRKHLDNYEKNPCLDNLEDLTHAATRIIMVAEQLISENIYDYTTRASRHGLPSPKEVDASEFKLRP